MKFLFLLAPLGGCTILPMHAQAQTQALTIQGPLRGPVQVVRVVDGDTARLAINGVEENARLIDIDTPETVHPTRGVEPFGPKASASRSGCSRVNKYGSNSTSRSATITAARWSTSTYLTPQTHGNIRVSGTSKRTS